MPICGVRVNFMKKKSLILAAAVAASCTVIFSGCGGSTKTLASLSSNWYSNVTYRDVQPTMTEGNALFTDSVGAEKIVYRVTHAQPDEKMANGIYSVNYSDGTFVTEFYAAEFNVANYAFGDLAASYAGKEKMTAYCYKTTLDIPNITFTLGENTKEFEGDKVTTESWFLPVKDNLRPLYSKRVIKSTTPANLQPTALEENNAYTLMDRSYESFYSLEGEYPTAVKSVMVDNLAKGEKTKTVENTKLSKSKYALFDVDSLNVVVRANNISTSLSQSISLYVPDGAVRDFTLTGSATALDADKDAASVLLANLAEKLSAKGLYKAQKDNNGNDMGLQTVAVQVMYTSGELPGVQQTYWFAAVDNKINNVSRATMVKYSTPLTYNLGTLNYTLDYFESTLWNK